MTYLIRSLIAFSLFLFMAACQTPQPHQAVQHSRVHPDFRTPYYYPPPVLNDRLPASLGLTQKDEPEESKKEEVKPVPMRAMDIRK